MVARTTIPPIWGPAGHIRNTKPNILNAAQTALRAFVDTPDARTLETLQNAAKTWNPMGSGTWDDAAKQRCATFLAAQAADGSTLTLQAMANAGISFDRRAIAEDSPRAEALLTTPLSQMDKAERSALLDAISPKAKFVAAVISGVPDGVPVMGRGSR